MGSNYKLKYNVDVVMCIDATGSMGRLLDVVKNNAMNFYDDIKIFMEEKSKHIDKFRVKLVIFRDYLADGEGAMLATDFFLLPEEAKHLKKLLDSIEADGGGDEPEDGLEALAYAIKSDWCHDGDKRRHVIIVWSDDGTHELGFAQNASNYPSAMAKNFDELTDWWGDSTVPGLMDNDAKRLIIYAPEKKYWTTIADNWDNVIFFPSEAGNGLQNLEYREIIDAVGNSVV